MSETKMFIEDPLVVEDILRRGLEAGVSHARLLGAEYGSMVVAIVYDGQLHTRAKSLKGDVSQDSDRHKTWYNDPLVGVNYLGYAFGKIAQCLRTGRDSDEDVALGYGESDSKGACIGYNSFVSSDGDPMPFILLASFSGLTQEQDLLVSRVARLEMDTIIQIIANQSQATSEN